MFRSRALGAPRRRGLVTALLCAAAVGVFAPAGALAGPGPLSDARRFDLPAQPLSQALNQLALRSDREILFSPTLTLGRRSPSLSGTFTAEQALARLLAGSGLTFRLEGRSFLVVPAPKPREEPEARPSPVAPPIDLDSLVVTALKRSSLVQRTPVSMVVVDGEQLSRMAMANIEQAAPMLPGLKLISTAFGRRLVLRGVHGAGEATTGLYYDETPMTGPVGTTADPGVMAPELALVDVDRIELLRGPQGTLYGSGAMGGALRILFKRPDLGGDTGLVGVSVASLAHGGRSASAAAVLNAVVVPDALAVRLTAYDQRQPGVIDNIRLGLSDVDDSRVRGVRLAALWEKSPRLSVLVSGSHQSSHRGDISAWNDTAGPWRTVHAGRAPFDGDIDLASAVVKWRGDAVDITAVSSWYRWKLVRRSDYSGVLLGERTSAAGCRRMFSIAAACSGAQMAGYSAYVDSVYPAILNQPADLTARIHEIRAASIGSGPLRWSLGAYSEVREDYIDSQVRHVDPATGGPVEPTVLIGRRDIENHLSQHAVFGEASYAVAPGAELTIGARRFDYVKRDRGAVQIPNVISGTWMDYAIDARARERGWSLKALASREFAPGLFGYAQISQGFRPGGVNVVPGLPETLAVYRSDRLDNAELGLKSQSADRRLALNLALYRARWRDMQYAAQTQNRAFNYVTNIGAARIQGLEVEGTARKVAGWDLAASLTLTDARLTADQVANSAIGLGLKGDRLPSVPKVSASASVERRWTLADALTARLRFDAHYAGVARSAFNAGNADYLKMGGYAAFGVSAGLENRAWSADLSVENLLDRAGRASAARNTFGPVEYFGIMPRAVRLSLERRF
ncbi:TonB-dependent receptor [Caulobacter segnis]|uniref:TonB-dependent receptor n=1 Tax=Caulobacter segnis TaxID=88688 RepID=UPI0028586304|nr:TonB-dependent receptor [Caulobacter segnis]MDR6624973.1 outer membrane receptor protein involved in Fe transport [Caulobacter segnis]